MSEEKNVPNIRFKGFTDPWEQRKLGEITASYSGGTPAISNKKLYGGEIPFIRSSEINSKKTELSLSELGLRNSSAKLVRKGIILYALYGATSGEVGISRINGAINQAILAIQPSEGYISGFIAQWLKLNKQRIVSKYLQGGQGNLSGTIIKKLSIIIPKKEEQIKVCESLQSIDTTIALHQQKVTQLKELKKLLMQKIFDQEWRFKGFTDPWEQRKLGEVANIVGGGTPSTSNPEYWNGSVDWYTPAEIGDHIYINNSKKKITELGLKKSSAQMLPKGTILFTSRAGIGNTGILIKEGSTNQGFQSIVPKGEKLDSYFIYTCSNMLKRYGEKYGAGSTFIEISGRQMTKMPINVPAIKEQSKIGHLSKKVDITIALHQQKVDQLKELKKYLMQNLFV